MSSDWVHDIANMHNHYGFHEKIKELNLTKDQMNELLKFRLKFLVEELNETSKAVDELDAEEIVDGLIDLCVVAIGTLDLFHIDSYLAWNRVLEANMSKEAGIKPERPNPLGLPDLMKPEGWTAPSHEDNHGILNTLK